MLDLIIKYEPNPEVDEFLQDLAMKYQAHLIRPDYHPTETDNRIAYSFDDVENLYDFLFELKDVSFEFEIVGCLFTIHGDIVAEFNLERFISTPKNMINFKELNSQMSEDEKRLKQGIKEIKSFSHEIARHLGLDDESEENDDDMRVFCPKCNETLYPPYEGCFECGWSGELEQPNPLKKNSNSRVAILDFDGTIQSEEYPNLADPFKNSVDIINGLVKRGWRVYIVTGRVTYDLVKNYLINYKVYYTELITRPVFDVFILNEYYDWKRKTFKSVQKKENAKPKNVIVVDDRKDILKIGEELGFTSVRIKKAKDWFNVERTARRIETQENPRTEIYHPKATLSTESQSKTPHNIGDIWAEKSFNNEDAIVWYVQFPHMRDSFASKEMAQAWRKQLLEDLKNGKLDLDGKIWTPEGKHKKLVNAQNPRTEIYHPKILYEPKVSHKYIDKRLHEQYSWDVLENKKDKTLLYELSTGFGLVLNVSNIGKKWLLSLSDKEYGDDEVFDTLEDALSGGNHYANLAQMEYEEDNPRTEIYHPKKISNICDFDGEPIIENGEINHACDFGFEKICNMMGHYVLKMDGKTIVACEPCGNDMIGRKDVVLLGKILDVVGVSNPRTEIYHPKPVAIPKKPKIYVNIYPELLKRLNGKKRKRMSGRNTYLVSTETISDNKPVIAYMYHETNVVTVFEDGTIVIDSNGYRTHTTKSRINDIIRLVGCRVNQKDYSWYLYDADDNKFDFRDEMELTIGSEKISNPRTEIYHPKPKTWYDQAIFELGELGSKLKIDDSMDANIEEGHAYLVEEDGNEEWRIFKDHETAENYAVEQVKSDLENEPEMFTQSFLERYLYVGETDKHMIANEAASNYVDDLEEERVINEANMEDEWKELCQKEDEKNTDPKQLEKDKEKFIEDAREKLRDELAESTKQQLTDDILNYIHDLGYKSYTETSFVKINIDDAAKAAVDEDGVAHFLASYDDEEVELPSGAYAYRIN